MAKAPFHARGIPFWTACWQTVGPRSTALHQGLPPQRGVMFDSFGHLIFMAYPFFSTNLNIFLYIHWKKRIFVWGCCDISLGVSHQTWGFHIVLFIMKRGYMDDIDPIQYRTWATEMHRILLFFPILLFKLRSDGIEFMDVWPESISGAYGYHSSMAVFRKVPWTPK